MITGETKITGLVGNPVVHSLSPSMQNAAYRAAGLNYIYLPFAVPRDYLPGAARAVVSLGMAGVNVTSPYKEEIIPYLDELAEEAGLLGAVNTVVNSSGKLKGYNTDVAGVLYLLESAALPVEGEKVCLLGAGGAAKAAALALAKAGARSIVVANRSVKKAQALKEELCNNGCCREESVELSGLDKDIFYKKLSGAALIVNCTSADPVENELLPPPGELKSLMAAVDLRYNPADPPFLKWGLQAGCAAVNGLDMLLGQGARSFEIFTGRKAPVAAMKSALSEVCA